MTLREAVVEAIVELGVSRDEVELQVKTSSGLIPDSAELAGSTLEPGHEREFIEALKEVYRRVKADPKAARKCLNAEIEKRTKWN